MPTHAAVQRTGGKLQLNGTALIDTTVDNVITVGMIRQFRRLDKKLKPNKLNTHQKFFDQLVVRLTVNHCAKTKTLADSQLPLGTVGQLITHNNNFRYAYKQ